MIETITDAIATGNIYDIEEFVLASLEHGITPSTTLEAMMAGLKMCGEEFEVGRYFLPELMMSAEAFKKGMKVLEPKLTQKSLGYEGKILLGTVQGDVHDIGKNLVGFLLKGAGFEVIDLGINVPTELFVDAVKEHTPDVLGLSALLTTTMLSMGDIITALKDHGIRDKVKVIIGGAPVSERYCKTIGADAYAFDAVAGVEKIRKLISG